MASEMADYRFIIADGIIKGEYSFDYIAVSSVTRFMLCAGYNYLVENCDIEPIEHNPDGMQDAMNMAKEYAPNLDEKETMRFCKCMLALEFTVQQLQNGGRHIETIKGAKV